MLEAKRLLTQTDASVAGVVSQLGFSEPTNFTKFLVRHAGTTPTGHRRATTDAAPAGGPHPG